MALTDRHTFRSQINVTGQRPKKPMANQSMMKNTHGEKTVSPISGPGKTGKRLKIRTFPHTIYKNKLKWIKHLNVRLQTIQLLEENTGRTFSDISCSNVFLDPSLKAKEMKAKIKDIFRKLRSWHLVPSPQGK